MPFDPYRNSFTLLGRFKIPLAVSLEPFFEVFFRRFELVAVDQASAKSFKECAGAGVIGELIVSLELRSKCGFSKKLFVKGCQPAFDPAKAEAAFSRDSPVGKAESQVAQCFG